VAARIENGVEVFLLDAVEANGPVKLSFRSDILFESNRQVGPELGLVTLAVERRATTFRGCERDFYAGVPENEVGSGKLLEPETACVLLPN
jgi:hypothetical protein